MSCRRTCNRTCKVISKVFCKLFPWDGQRTLKVHEIWGSWAINRCLRTPLQELVVLLCNNCQPTTGTPSLRNRLSDPCMDFRRLNPIPLPPSLSERKFASQRGSLKPLRRSPCGVLWGFPGAFLAPSWPKLLQNDSWNFFFCEKFLWSLCSKLQSVFVRIAKRTVSKVWYWKEFLLWWCWPQWQCP